MTLRLGLGLPQLARYDPRRDVLEVARAAERTGFDSVWVFERTAFPLEPLDGLYRVPGLPWPGTCRYGPDPLVALSLAAAVTGRVRLGGGVLVGGPHAPFPFARTLATLDAASGGRVLAGLGTGWSPEEHRTSRVTEFGDRGARLEKLLDVCAAVWGAGPIPVYLAATGGPALERVARRADGWLPGPLTGDQLAPLLGKLTEAAERYGRTAAPDVAMRVAVEPSGAPLPEAERRPYTGSPEQILGDLAGAAEAGAREILLDLQGCCRDGKELADRAAELYARIRAAGL
ncbi:LLM class flavin-dependent oxidoreductase [Streptomyces gilvosporeus]|uniref:LLM class F420-dependent oxidoreductase n=1 Tax=Streptomyces gilvosporeus TaxID=553510 RepID=A0A1V0TN50_9ACTN|nr:LLM class flavin-dependent oxidoreductase [Streptomyces gilvosporeus]ARF54361.1 LLM class F420-dependent oxidoreductase [Streptomyces gilvosporeus]